VIVVCPACWVCRPIAWSSSGRLVMASRPVFPYAPARQSAAALSLLAIRAAHLLARV
jgi:hypothetical protein